ncbi:hypothetical protein [Syntrophomonas palmitatica]|uniref:hypothetical protein n=1 Tax=Syntrophomonas palmitatica TaxID=402877 RepID=UPI001A9A3826|nr:hypothetical protein [Syntrophomonas palmitatica]
MKLPFRMDGEQVLIYGQEIRNRMQEEIEMYARDNSMTMAVIQVGDNEAPGFISGRFANLRLQQA